MLLKEPVEGVLCGAAAAGVSGALRNTGDTSGLPEVTSKRRNPTGAAAGASAAAAAEKLPDSPPRSPLSGTMSSPPSPPPGARRLAARGAGPSSSGLAVGCGGREGLWTPTSPLLAPAPAATAGGENALLSAVAAATAAAASSSFSSSSSAASPSSGGGGWAARTRTTWWRVDGPAEPSRRRRIRWHSLPWRHRVTVEGMGERAYEHKLSSHQRRRPHIMT